MKSLDELRLIREKMHSHISLRYDDSSKSQNKTETATWRSNVVVCGGPGCHSSGCVKIMNARKEEIRKNGLEDQVDLVQTGCHGLCALGPIVIVYPGATFYAMVKEEDVAKIVTEHLLNGNVVEELVYEETITDKGLIPLTETDFYKYQHRIALQTVVL